LVYVTVPGTLDEVLVKQGDEVAEGTPLVRLSSIDLDLQIAELEGKVAQYKARLASLQVERFTDPTAALEIGTAEDLLKSDEEKLAKKLKDRRELVLVAPRDGVVLPAASVQPQPDPTGKLPAWTGHALDERNLGATFTEGTVLCMVGEAERFEAVMVVDQSEVEFIERGQPVALKLDAFAWKTFTGTVAEIAETHIENGSERLSVKAGGQVPTETDPSGREVPISTSYEAMMTLDDAEAVLTPGMRGTARIEVGSRTVGGWLLRLLWQTFNFRM
jgi:putative peptide zinc metalloprotease protein